MEINFITKGWFVNSKYDESKSIYLSLNEQTIKFEGLIN